MACIYHPSANSSSAVDDWFRIAKKDIVLGKSKLRVGQFIISLHKSLKGSIKARLFDFDKPVIRKTPKRRKRTLWRHQRNGDKRSTLKVRVQRSGIDTIKYHT